MKQTINEMLEQKVAELCNGSEETKAKVEEILSLQRQIDIKPMEIHIEESEVRERYKITEAMEIIRCDTKICFHTPYFWVISKPSLANNLKGGALYETLEWLCDYKANRNEYSEEDRERYDTYVNVVVSLLALPLDVFTDMDFTLDIATDVMEKRAAYYERLTQKAKEIKKETLEEINENLQFEASLEAEAEMLKK